MIGERTGLRRLVPGDCNLLVLAERGKALDARLRALAVPERPDAVIVANAAGKALALCDRILFDLGLLRLAEPAGEPSALYLRSDRIDDVNATGGRTRATNSISNFGHNAGFANQLFQYAFLKLYGLRNNCAVETPGWIGETVYAIPQRPITRHRRRYKGDQWSVADLALWQSERPPVDVDFWGYYQNVPESWRYHRAFLRRLYTALPAWRDPVARFLARHRPQGRTLVAIHLRRGDYANFDPTTAPWFRMIPAEWYRRWLDTIWPTLEAPVLYVATDGGEAVLPAFAEYAPLTAAEIEREMPAPGFLADFQILAATDVLAICNSSFSRMAALLASERQRCFIPVMTSERFEPYEPWAPDHFWQRFGAPETLPRRRPLLPRWLRGLRP